MGVDYRSQTVVGIYAGNTMEDVIDLLTTHGLVDGYDDYCDNHCEDREMLMSSLFEGRYELFLENSWSGEGYYLGVESDDWREYDNLINQFNKQTGFNGDVHTFTKVF